MLRARSAVGLILAMAMVAAGSISSPAAELDPGRGTVERRGSEDGVDLYAEENRPGGPGDGADGCSFWDEVTVADIGLVPPELVAGLGEGEGGLSRRTVEGFIQILFVRLCPDQAPRIQYRWFDEVPALRALAIRARESLLLPLPAPRFSPPAATARTLVGVGTWFWVPAEDWTAVEATAVAGNVSVTATATPVLLRFDPGDGSRALTCTGPGTPWVEGAESTCAYTYAWVSAHHPDGRWPASVSIDWEVTWSASTGQSGILDPFVMVADVALLVAQAEAVLTLREG